MGLYTHDQSMAEQGSWYTIEVVGTQAITIPAGVTNVLIVGSSTPIVTRLKTVERAGRKIRFMARTDSDSTQFTDGENIKTTGASSAIDSWDSIEFICAPDADGTLFFIETNLSNIT
jgi:hypothetical protein